MLSVLKDVGLAITDDLGSCLRVATWCLGVGENLRKGWWDSGLEDTIGCPSIASGLSKVDMRSLQRPKDMRSTPISSDRHMKPQIMPGTTEQTTKETFCRTSAPHNPRHQSRESQTPTQRAARVDDATGGALHRESFDNNFTGVLVFCIEDFGFVVSRHWCRAKKIMAGKCRVKNPSLSCLYVI